MRHASRFLYWRDLLRELVARDLKMRYQRSVLGLGWSLLKPLSQLLVFSFVFNKVLPLNIPHYTTFVFAGVLAWSWLASALMSGVLSITGNPELVRRPGFPTYLLPVLAVLSNCMHFLLALPVLLVFAVIDAGMLGLSMLALPAVMVVQLLFTLALSYVLAACHVYFRDTQHFVGIAIMLGFYVTPVFYAPIKSHEAYGFLTQFNPMALILTGYRDILIDHRWPEAEPLLVLCLILVPVMALALMLFNRVSTRFAEEL